VEIQNIGDTILEIYKKYMLENICLSITFDECEERALGIYTKVINICFSITNNLGLTLSVSLLLQGIKRTIRSIS
jgi:hypothetical protein